MRVTLLHATVEYVSAMEEDFRLRADIVIALDDHGQSKCSSSLPDGELTQAASSGSFHTCILSTVLVSISIGPPSGKLFTPVEVLPVSEEYIGRY
jgi:hypothetical protein